MLTLPLASFPIHNAPKIILILDSEIAKACLLLTSYPLVWQRTIVTRLMKKLLPDRRDPSDWLSGRYDTEFSSPDVLSAFGYRSHAGDLNFRKTKSCYRPALLTVNGKRTNSTAVRAAVSKCLQKKRRVLFVEQRKRPFPVNSTGWQGSAGSKYPPAKRVVSPRTSSEMFTGNPILYRFSFVLPVLDVCSCQFVLEKRRSWTDKSNQRP